MSRAAPRIDRRVTPLGGFRKGMYSGTAKMIPRGYAKEITNFRFHPRGLISRPGFETIEQGLTIGYPGAASGGLSWASVGTFPGWRKGYTQNDNGKVIVFQKVAYCDTDTGAKFASGTTSTVSAVGGEDWLGVVYFAGDFIIYTATKAYAITMADGSTTLKLTFASDIGAAYSPVLELLVRFGQLWGVTSGDRVFWSNTREYAVANGSAVTDEYIEKKIGEWQMLDTQKIATSPAAVVEYGTMDTWSIRNYMEYEYFRAALIGNLTNFAYINADVTGVFSGGETITVMDLNTGQEIDSDTVSSVALNTTDLSANVASGATTITVQQGTDHEGEAFYAGQDITLADDSNSETNAIKSITLLGSTLRIELEAATSNAYTTAANAKITATNVTKLVINNTWKVTRTGQNASIGYETFANAVADTDYTFNYDPDNDDTADGHIKLLPSPSSWAARRIRVDYTPHTNPWLEFSSGFVDLKSSKGDNIDVCEGPDYQEGEGTELLYIFKNNGDIIVLTGKPGVDGTPGGLDESFIAGGMRARPNTAFCTKDGVIFGQWAGREYHVRFIPHGKRWMDADEVPMLDEMYDFDTDIPFDNSSYDFSEQFIPLYGDGFLLSFPNKTGSAPYTTNGYIYHCMPEYDQQLRKWVGRWLRWHEHIEDEYEDDNASVDIPATAVPYTVGFYMHDGDLYRIYHVKTGHDYAGNTRYYEICRLGWLAGSEECKDKYVFTKDAGGGTYTTFFGTDYYYHRIITGMIALAKRIRHERIWWEIDTVGGSDGDGIDLQLDIFKDLDETNNISSNFYPEDIADLTDASGALNLLRFTKAKFRCRYFQYDLRFDNVKYDSHPAYVLVRDVLPEYAILTPAGVLSEENQ